jgi:ATP-dependent DNA ligase
MKPMLAQPMPMENIAKVADYVMEPKLDGMRLLLIFDSRGKLCKALTRSGRDVFLQLPQEWREVIVSKHAADAIIDCEFGYEDAEKTSWDWPILDFNKTMRVMGSAPKVAQLKADQLKTFERETPVAFCFDIQLAHYEGKETYRERRADLDDVLYNSAFPFTYMRMVDMLDYGWHEPYYDHYVERGGEGVMMKNPESLYIPGGRPTKTWYKIKKYSTADVVITGYTEGTGKYSGFIGAVKFSIWDTENKRYVEVGQCSGMTDQMRMLISSRREEYMHSVMEIKYFGFTAGTPRHPQFYRMRDDKEPQDCILIS